VHEGSGKLTGAAMPGDGKIERALWLASRDMRKLDARRRAGERSAGSVWKWKKFNREVTEKRYERRKNRCHTIIQKY